MNSSLDNSYREIIDYLKHLEKRIARLESRLNIESTEDAEKTNLPEKPALNNFQTESWEFRIGQYWFAKGGIIFLSIGIILLLTFPYPKLPEIFPSLIGYLLVAAIFFLANYWQKTFAYISGFLFGSELISKSLLHST